MKILPIANCQLPIGVLMVVELKGFQIAIGNCQLEMNYGEEDYRLYKVAGAGR